MKKGFSKFSILVFWALICLLNCFAAELFAGEYEAVFNLSQPIMTTLDNGNTLVEMDGTWQKDAVIGAPILPVKTSKIFVPADEKVVSINVEASGAVTLQGSYVIQHGTKFYPMSYTGPIDLDLPDPLIYSMDSYYPEEVYEQKSSQYFHGVQIVPVDIFPVMYNPGKNQVMYYSSIKVSLATETISTPAGVMPYKDIPQENRQILDSIDNKEDFLLTNPSGIESHSGTDGQTLLPQAHLLENQSSGDLPKKVDVYDYVVITTAAMETAFQSLIDHRASAAGGSFSTHMENIEYIKTNYSGVDDAEKMRNFIIDMYVIIIKPNMSFWEGTVTVLQNPRPYRPEDVTP